MQDSYHLPALILTVLLLPAFFQLYLRFRNTRTLLWFLGFCFAILCMLQYYNLGWWNFTNPADHPWIVAGGETAILISSALFLASLAPYGFRIGRVKILYAIPFTIPLVAYAFLFYGVYGGKIPSGFPFLIFPALGGLSLFSGCAWGFSARGIPRAVPVTLCIILGAAGLWIFVRAGGDWPLVFVECAMHATTALLVFYAFRRISAGTILASLGFIGWSLNVGETLPFLHISAPGVNLVRIIVMSKVVAAMGMIVLALEDELAVKQSGEARERHAREEMEAYSRLSLAKRRVEDFDRQAPVICQSIIANSRYKQAALTLLQGTGNYRLAGAAGFDDATVTALEALLGRIPVAGFLEPGSAPETLALSQTVNLDLTPFFLPGDDLKRLKLTTLQAIPLRGRSSTEGALFLAGLENPAMPITAVDLLPLEVLASRIQSVRSQTMMLERLVEAEKFVGLGQLAGNVTRQLNNPLTVILGYASLLDETEDLNQQTHKAIEAILNEARHMRLTLESLARISRPQTDQIAAISVTELLGDLEQLHRSEFVQRSIDFRVHIPPALPRVLGNAQQVRQAVLYCLQFAMEAVEKLDAAVEKTVRLEAVAEKNQVQILVAHTGSKFASPARAFDPFVPEPASEDSTSIALSMCASILRENNGKASALNFEPRGAGILLELQAA
ncbi:MAG TPA: histidine kinase dimerization/phospho-acceptor domain-containing protein [Terracidiphilus sp.]|nr:histidine kinase dimerization/phospho-acceptor domain-containing protein [Terracidiphilus sp.]